MKKIILGSVEFEIVEGLTLRFYRAQQEAGHISADIEKDIPAFVVWAGKFLQAYLGVSQEFIDNCRIEEIQAAMTTILEAVKSDPFVQKQRQTPEQSENTQMTTTK